MKREKILGLIQKLMAHLCVICSVAFLITKILDWYNPFMNFQGNSGMIQYLLCFGALALGIMNSFQGGKKRRKRRKKTRRPTAQAE